MRKLAGGTPGRSGGIRTGGEREKDRSPAFPGYLPLRDLTTPRIFMMVQTAPKIEHMVTAPDCATVKTVIKSMAQHLLTKGVATEASEGFEFADEDPPPASITNYGSGGGWSVTDNSKEEHNREVSKLCLEYFKHLTTIATAAALVELGLYQQLGLTTVSALVGVGTLGLTLSLCILGMVLVPTRAAAQGDFSESGRSYLRLLAGTAVLFLFGVVTFAVAAINPALSTIVNVLLTSAVLLPVLLPVITAWLRGRGSP